MCTHVYLTHIWPEAGRDIGAAECPRLRQTFIVVRCFCRHPWFSACPSAEPSAVVLHSMVCLTPLRHACVGQKPGLGQHVSVPGSPQEHCPTWTFSFCFQLSFLLLPLMSAASQWNHKENWSLAILLSPDLRYLKSKIFFSAFDLNNFVVVVNPQGYFKVKGFLLDPADLRFEDLFFKKAS